MIEPKSVLTGKIFSGEPVVSVCVITYNHGKYIRQCLDGILMQEVTFPYEILIHDDASPDNTAEIIREYEAKYPEIIKPIYQTVNQYSQGIDVGKYNFERAVGKYIAFCEGDDYWTDPKKLQMQVDFLEKHPKYVGTAHNVRVIDETGEDVADTINPYPTYSQHKFTIHDTEYMRLPGQSASLVYVNIYRTHNKSDLEEYYHAQGVGDRKLAVYLTLHGDIYCIQDTMSIYRHITTGGTSWSSQMKNKNQSKELFSYCVDMWNIANKKFHTEWICYIYSISLFIGSVNIYISNSTKENRKHIEEIIEKFIDNPRYCVACIIYCMYHPIQTLKRINTQLRLKRVVSTVTL